MGMVRNELNIMNMQRRKPHHFNLFMHNART